MVTALHSRSPAASGWIALAVGLVATVALILHATSYPLVTYDDAFISLRYAQRLLDGHGLTWTDGPPVEGYSNLLWVLGCAALAALGVPLVKTPVVLGIASSIALIGAVVYAFAPRRWSDALPSFAASMFLALAGPIGLWAVSGLEGCLVAALLAWAVVLLRPLFDRESVQWQRAWLPGIPLALLCLTRPDGPLLTLAVCGFLLVRSQSRAAVHQALAVGALPALATLGQVVFRLVYYGDWLPNTARAKVAFSAARLDSGTECVAEASRSSYALWIPAILALYVASRDVSRRGRIFAYATLFGVWTLYVATVTCQEFGYRMLIPSYVLLAFLVAEALEWMQERGPRTRLLAWVSTVLLLVVFGRAQQRDKNIAIARWNNPPITVQAATVGNTLGAAFSDRDPLVAVDAAGAIPFFSGLRSLDMLGLNDAHIARAHDESFGQGVQGHELGDGNYVLSRKPDIIVAGVTGSSRLAFRSGKEMEADPRFHQHYRRVRVRGEEPVPVRFNIHVRLDGRVGIERTDETVAIPGYLLARAKGTRAELDRDDGLRTHFIGPVHTDLEGIPLGPGTWRIRVNGEGGFAVGARRRSDGQAAVQVREGMELRLDSADLVDLEIGAQPPSFISSVTLQRISP